MVCSFFSVFGLKVENISSLFGLSMCVYLLNSVVRLLIYWKYRLECSMFMLWLGKGRWVVLVYMCWNGFSYVLCFFVICSIGSVRLIVIILVLG